MSQSSRMSPGVYSSTEVWLYHPLHFVAGGLRDVASLGALAPIFVDNPALLVHHVVIFEHPLC